MHVYEHRSKSCNNAIYLFYKKKDISIFLVICNCKYKDDNFLNKRGDKEKHFHTQKIPNNYMIPSLTKKTHTYKLIKHIYV